jgi:hypothetical protein
MRAPVSVLRLLFGAAVFTTACSNSGTEPSTRTPGIHFVAGNGVADTIGSVLPQALVVEIRDQSGQVVPGVIVRFEAIATTSGGYGWPAFETMVGRLDQPTRGSFVSDTTDAKGQAKAIVQLGDRVGTARTAIMAPVYGFVDTAVFTVRAGNAARITVKVRDTVATIGTSYSLGATASDRNGDPRTSDVVTYTSTSNAASVDAAGTVKALAPGRGKIVMRAGTYADTAWLSILPDLTIAAVSDHSPGRAVVTVKVDGSQLTPLTSISSQIVMPRWNAAGTRVTFYEYDPNINAQIYTVDLQGHRVPFMDPLPSDPHAEFFPRYSADGQWVYFSGLSSTAYVWQVWRAHLDGTGAELIATAPNGSASQASPSPDGSRLVFNQAGTISTIDLATRTIVSLGVQGDFPEYSPDGTKILFLAGSGYNEQLSVMNADGSNMRTLAGRYYDLYSSPSWSSDGKWIVIGGSWNYNAGAPELVDVATFDVLPLVSLRGISQPSFKP